MRHRLEALHWEWEARALALGCALLAALLAASPARAQSNAIERCRAIGDNTLRLQCYDAIDIAPSAPLSKYEAVEIDDLKSFALSYRGDLVEVHGWVSPNGNYLALGADASDKNPLPVDIGSLTRRDRQNFLAACGTGCNATVQGRVQPVNFTTGIVADALFAR
jgi:hypothetical protein